MQDCRCPFAHKTHDSQQSPVYRKNLLAELACNDNAGEFHSRLEIFSVFFLKEEAWILVSAMQIRVAEVQCEEQDFSLL